MIDPTARVEAGATLGRDVTIGPYCIVGANVTLGDGCRLAAHVNLAGYTTLGPRTKVSPFASLGTPPQSGHYHGEPTRLVIGVDCDIREGVMMSTGTEKGGGVTTVGDRCFFMAYSHVAHDCTVGNDVTFANGATLGGHCNIGDFVFIGGLTAVHQFGRIGESAMIGGMTGVAGDVIPFGLATGNRCHLDGVNVVGMRRRKFSREWLHAVRGAVRVIFDRARGEMPERLAAVEAEYAGIAPVQKIVTFLRAERDRPLAWPRDTGGD